MTALVKWNDALLITSDRTHENAGTNYKDNRSVWYGLSSIAFPTGSWIVDEGPNTIDVSLREPRKFTLVGTVSFTFTGTTLVARVNTDYGWGSAASVKIDGVSPSTLGLLSYSNTLSCNSATYLLAGPGYVDVVLADGLSNTTHTVVITSNGSGSSYFSLVGFKVYGFASKPLTFDRVTIIPPSVDITGNLLKLTLKTGSPNPIINPLLTFTSGSFVNSSLAALTQISSSQLSSSSPIVQTLYPNYTGYEVSGDISYSCTLSGLYKDPAGTVSQTVPVTVLVGDAAITVAGAFWNVDSATQTGQTRIFTSKFATTNYLKFTFNGDALSITVQQDSGWGVMGIYDSDNATLLKTVTCLNNVTPGVVTFPLTGFGTGDHTVYLRKSVSNSQYIVFISASWTGSAMYTNITETVTLVASASQPVPLAVTGVALDSNGCDLTFTPPVLTDVVTGNFPIRSNKNVAYTETMTRFPTYAVCYQPGYFDVLSQYDILIVDPFAASAVDVLAWQAMGIKVFGYISFGEEDGVYSNRYDFTSANGPYIGDGTGPGGYAGYYLKTGYGSRETHECQNDNQAVGSKTCAQSQPQYYQGTGRCGLTCSNDSLNGNIAWATGGHCAAGYTKNNKWQRASAMSACVNATCPSFTPIHKLQNGTLCPKYTAPTNAYLQDFSAATPNFPDQNGTWGSYFTNPSVGSGWMTRLLSFYAPLVLNGPVTYTAETVTCAAATISSGSVIVFDTVHYPVDDSSPIILKTLDGVTTYLINVDFTLNPKTGAVVFNTGIVVPVVATQQLLITYTKKGHTMDGIFMDTIDDADVYPATGPSMAAIINSVKTSIGEKWLLSNRGFSNLDSYIKSCKGVMFESWLVDYNFNTGVYSKITDQDSIDYNDSVNSQLLRLRAENTFDVYSLNYCAADSSGDPLRTYIREEDAKRGYLSWSSTIELNVPSANNEVPTPTQKIKSNVYKRFKIKSI